MIVHIQHGNVALARRDLISPYFSYSILGRELGHQVVGRSYGLPRVKGRTAQDGIVGRRIVNNQYRDIPSDLLRVITDRHKQSNYTKVVYFCPSESNEQCVGWNQPFSLNPHLLECRVVEDISKAPIVYKDPMSVVVPNLHADYKHIIVWVVETSSILLCEPNYMVFDACYLWD